MTWEAYLKRMRSSGTNGEGELSGQPANQVHLEKWLLKQECVCVSCVI